MEAEEETWFELRLLVPSLHGVERDAFEKKLQQAFPAGFLLEGSGTQVAGSERPPVEEGFVRYVLYALEAEREEKFLVLTQLSQAYPEASLSLLPLDPDWKERWKRFFEMRRLSKRITVSPPWEKEKAPETELLVLIEPALAFGTGLHETTALCVRGLDELLEKEIKGRMLDVGMGSGILSIVASALGVKEVKGIDIDPIAVSSAYTNLALNEKILKGELSFSDEPVESLEGTWPIVVANILAPIILGMKEALFLRLEKGGTLFLSGILKSQADEMKEAFLALGLAFLAETEMGEWVRLDFRKP